MLKCGLRLDLLTCSFGWNVPPVLLIFSLSLRFLPHWQDILFIFTNSRRLNLRHIRRLRAQQLKFLHAHPHILLKTVSRLYNSWLIEDLFFLPTYILHFRLAALYSSSLFMIHASFNRRRQWLRMLCMLHIWVPALFYELLRIIDPWTLIWSAVNLLHAYTFTFEVFGVWLLRLSTSRIYLVLNLQRRSSIIVISSICHLI